MSVSRVQLPSCGSKTQPRNVPSTSQRKVTKIEKTPTVTEDNLYISKVSVKCRKNPHIFYNFTVSRGSIFCEHLNKKKDSEAYKNYKYHNFFKS